MSSSILKSSFGKLADGKEVFTYTLTNKNGVRMQVINYGATITSLFTPNRDGVFEDIVLGFDTLEEYVSSNNPYFGGVIGRYCNRIANGEFKLDKKRYTLVKNNNGQHLHGGLDGFHRVFWNIEEVSSSNEGLQLHLSYVSPHLEEGYPGTLTIDVFYTLTDNDELIIDYKATTDQKTVINLTNHSYFNLTGDCKRDVLDHELILQSYYYIPVDENAIPLGDLENVEETPFDFLNTASLGARIDEDDKQIKLGKGYDHTFVLEGDIDVLSATVYEPTSGRTLEMYTSEPGVQLYTGNYLDGLSGKNGVSYQKRTGFCLEAQHYPNSPNESSFPTVVLDVDEEFTSRTIYRFLVQ